MILAPTGTTVGEELAVVSLGAWQTGAGGKQPHLPGGGGGGLPPTTGGGGGGPPIDTLSGFSLSLSLSLDSKRLMVSLDESYGEGLFRRAGILMPTSLAVR